MRLIAEVFGRCWMFEFQSAKLVDPDEEAPDDEGDEEEVPKMWGGSASGGMVIEHAVPSSVEVQHFSGSGVFPIPDNPEDGRWTGTGFGSRGSKN